MAQASIQPFPNILPVSSLPFTAGLTAKAKLSPAGSPVSVNWATSFKQWNPDAGPAANETVDVSAKVPRFVLISNLSATSGVVYLDHATSSDGGGIPLAVGATLQLTVTGSSFPISVDGTGDFSILAQFGAA